MSVSFNPETIEAVSNASTGVYENSKGLFGPLRSFVDNAGDNPAVESVEANASDLEDVFNKEILPAFTEFKKGIRTYVSNIEEWDRAMKNLEPIDTKALQGVEVKSTVQPVDMG